jgi:hypothetical protein
MSVPLIDAHKGALPAMIDEMNSAPLAWTKTRFIRPSKANVGQRTPHLRPTVRNMSEIRKTEMQVGASMSFCVSWSRCDALGGSGVATVSGRAAGISRLSARGTS